MKTACLLAAILALSPLALSAKEVPFEVLPWNGYKAALSLTYDDADPIHLDVAIPEMNKRGLRGTFFLIAGKMGRDEEWKKAFQSGQEIGNHSWSHRHIADFKPGDEKTEVEQAKDKLEKLTGSPVLTFAYPFVEISPELKKSVAAHDFLARGGGGAAYLTPDQDPDWFNIPSQATMTAYAYGTYKDWVDQDLAGGAWTVLMIHAIEGSTWYQPIPKRSYLDLLDYLAQNSKQLWVAPFGEVGAYWRGQKTLEAAIPSRPTDQLHLTWNNPDHFPQGVQVKVLAQGDKLQVSQKGKVLTPIAKDTYLVSMDAGELTLKNVAWHGPTLAAAAGVHQEKAAVIDTSSVAKAPAMDVLKVDDFESGASALGGMWWEGCDGNGVTKLSPVPFTALPGGSPTSSGHCAGMKGHMGPMQAPWPWALLSLSLDPAGKPMDLSAYSAVRFFTQGDGKAHSLSLNKASVTDYCDFQGNFTSPAAWTRVTLKFQDLTQPNWGKQLEKTFNDVTKLTFTPGSADPDFDFKVDDVEFVK
ncbi:MAG TPA: CIA30 family protein [bacterium]|nr:CIA30 family protein [bacterium]